MITLKQIQQDGEVAALIEAGNAYLAARGYTDHGPRHVGYVSYTAAKVLRALGRTRRLVELAAIAGWVHDVGNCVNRHHHGATGAVLLLPLLRRMEMPTADALQIVTAVGNHEEEHGVVTSDISAALILADKTDAHRTRVRHGQPDPDDIHDRVNFAISSSRVEVAAERRTVRHKLAMDGSSSVLEYLQIYLPRIVMCESAASHLGCSFELVINGHTVNNKSEE
ncbi:MAG: HD domain-containing protein [Clostridia bacterium]|nr:HD domain-containing protein [Clostridia bacterium]